MFMKRRALLGALAAGTAAFSLSQPLAASDDTVRIAILPVDSSMEANYAVTAGFAQQARLALTIEQISSGAAILAAIVGGSLDTGNVNTFSILAAHDRGIPIVLIAGAVVYAPQSWNAALLVAKDSRIQGGADLNGKTIAISGLRSLPQFSAMAWIDKNGGDSKTVRFVEMPIPDMQAGLTAHRFDAASMSEPFASRAAKVDARILCHVDDGIGTSWLQSAWVTSAAWAAANPDVLRRFRTMIYRSAAWANGHQTQSAEILSQVSKVDLDVIRTMRRARYAEKEQPQLLEPVIDVALRYGVIAKRPLARNLFVT
jgi:NitT/TauT family transport system substrate-binding protein